MDTTALEGIMRMNKRSANIMDTQILNARRQLSIELSWDAERLVDYAVADESEPNLRRRLHIYTVRP